MDKQFSFGREIVIDNVIQKWNINTTSSNISGDHNMRLFRLKFGSMDFTSSLIQTWINVRIGDAGFVK